MNGQILCGDTLLRLPSARIAKDDVTAFRTSADLLERVKAMRDDAAIAAQAAQTAGYERGRQQALDEMRDALGEALAALTEGLTAENERRERAIAAAAMQVVERLIGQIDDRLIVSGLAREALRKAGAGPISVAVAPQWVEAVRERLADHAGLTVEPALVTDRFACRVTSQDGRIIADLDTQLAALRARWGLTAESSDG